MPANQLQRKFYETGSVYEDDEKFSGVQNGIMFHLSQRHGSQRATSRNSHITCYNQSAYYMHNQSAYYMHNQSVYFMHNQSAYYMHNQSAYYVHNQSVGYCLMVSSSRKEENRRCTRLRALVYAIFPPEGRVPESEAWSVMLRCGPIHGPI